MGGTAAAAQLAEGARDLALPGCGARRLLEVQRAENGGKWPETIAVVLWGTDNIKTYGESLAQVPAPALRGAAAGPDAFARTGSWAPPWHKPYHSFYPSRRPARR